MTRYLSAINIADALGISRARAYRLLAALPRVKIGRCVRVSERDLEAYLQKHKERGWDASTSESAEASSTGSITPPKESESVEASRPATRSSPKNDSDLPSWARRPLRAAGDKG